MTTPPPAIPLLWFAGPNKTLRLDRPRVMAILNLTPDSFFDGGLYPTLDHALRAADRAVLDGADLLDIGGESTRPGAPRTDPDEQLRRVLPLIRAIRTAAEPLSSIPISIDTTRVEVARAALDAGADAINDISGGTDDPDILPLAAQRSAGIVLMHRLVPPPQDSYSDRYAEPPAYNDVVGDVGGFLAGRAAAAVDAGIRAGAIVLDPGLGFGKTVEQNLDLIRRTPELVRLGYPILSAASRKSFVGRAAGLGTSTPKDRLPASIALSVAHYLAGASIFRVHDVAPQVQALRAAAALGRSLLGNRPG